jgi:hypothetical protein
VVLFHPLCCFPIYFDAFFIYFGAFSSILV